MHCDTLLSGGISYYECLLSGGRHDNGREDVVPTPRKMSPVIIDVQEVDVKEQAWLHTRIRGQFVPY